MPSSSQPQLAANNDIEADVKFNPKLAPLDGQRDADLPPPGKLRVTSALHPYLRTKTGFAVVALLVVLALIGGIVGGVIGNKKSGPSAATFSPVRGGATSSQSAAVTPSQTSSSAPEETSTRLLARAYPYPVRRKE